MVALLELLALRKNYKHSAGPGEGNFDLSRIGLGAVGNQARVGGDQGREARKREREFQSERSGPGGDGHKQSRRRLGAMLVAPDWTADSGQLRRCDGVAAERRRRRVVAGGERHGARSDAGGGRRKAALRRCQFDDQGRRLSRDNAECCRAAAQTRYSGSARPNKSIRMERRCVAS